MIPILMYHQVAEIPRKLDPLGLAVPPDQFEQQIRYLAQNGYRCLALPAAVRYLRNGGHAPAKSFVLTFDDGYQNVYSEACPILEKFGFTATIFLVASQIGAASDWWGQEGERAGQLLSWAEGRDLARRGHILASHTLTHPRLSRLDDGSALEEIRDSKVLLQDRLDMQVDFFSYPYSDSDARIERLVESAGYTAACAGDSRPWSVFNLWRVPILRSETTLSLVLKASGWHHKRIALRESALGRLLRHRVRMFRRRLGIRHPSRYPVLNSDIDRRSETEP